MMMSDLIGIFFFYPLFAFVSLGGVWIIYEIFYDSK
jgi:hypothetical protein